MSLTLWKWDTGGKWWRRFNPTCCCSRCFFMAGCSRLKRSSAASRWRRWRWRRSWGTRSTRPRRKLCGFVSCERETRTSGAGRNMPRRSWSRWGRLKHRPSINSSAHLCSVFTAGPQGAEKGRAGAGVTSPLDPAGGAAEVAAADARNRSSVLQHQETERWAAAATGQRGGEWSKDNWLKFNVSLMDVSQGHFLLWKMAKKQLSRKQKPSLSPFKVVSRTSGAASTFRSVWKTCSDVLQTSNS